MTKNCLEQYVGMLKSGFQELDRDHNAAINIKWAGSVQRGEANPLVGEVKASQNKASVKRESKPNHKACQEQAA